MKNHAVEILKCVDCGGSLRLEDAERDGEEITAGSLVCESGHAFPIVRGVLRVVESDSYAQCFSFEWQLHSRTQIDGDANGESARVFKAKTELEPAELAGKRVLDVGVGAGRFADVCQRAGADVVGIDLSFSVEAAMNNVGRRKSVNIIQADLFNLPFRDESFDIIYSIGVLDHTPDCRRAFRGLLRYLRPGGTIVIWVYSAHMYPPGSALEAANKIYRSITTRLPSRLLYFLCICELPLYFFRKLPWAEKLMHLALPGAIYHAIPQTNDKARISEHLLDTFDWYSPTYVSKHTYPEVFSWFEEAGLEHIRVLPVQVSMCGRKPK